MSTTHQFSVEHAQQYGLREAVLIHNLHFWVAHNYANGTHEHDGRTWTYNTVHAFEDLFPYLTYKQIRTSLDTLVTLEVLVRGNYNKKPSDRTSWFAFTDAFLAENPLPYRANGLPKKTKASAPQGKWVAQQGTCTAQEGKSLIVQIVNTDVTLSPAAPAEPLAAIAGVVIEQPAEALKPVEAKPAKSAKPPKVEKTDAEKALEEKKAAQKEVCRQTWSAYCEAYQERYRIEPVRNETTNSQVVLLVKRIGKEAPNIARFYVQRVSEQFVVGKCHPLGLLLNSAEGYHTQWATNQAMTGTRANQIDKSQSNYDAAGEAKALIRARREQKNAE